MKSKAQREKERKDFIAAGWTTYDKDMRDLRIHAATFITMIIALILVIAKLARL
jgi:hypothetical protein